MKKLISAGGLDKPYFYYFISGSYFSSAMNIDQKWWALFLFGLSIVAYLVGIVIRERGGYE